MKKPPIGRFSFYASNVLQIAFDMPCRYSFSLLKVTTNAPFICEDVAI